MSAEVFEARTMLQPNPTGTTLPYLRLIHGFLLFSMFIYMGLGQIFVPHEQKEIKPAFLIAIGVASLATACIVLFIRAQRILPALETLRAKPDDGPSIARWRIGSVFSYALSESVMLYGFALRVMGASLPLAVPFYVGAVLLMILLWPGRP
jgi:hypothetical protein